MIFIKERTKPIYLLKLEAALRRVPDTHPNKQKILKEYLKQQSGYRGEKTVDYYLSLLPKEQTILLPNLRLKNNNNFHFQMDTLVLTPRFFLIIESKNSAGELIYDTETNELVRRKGTEIEIFSDPVLQVERQKLQLIELLQSFNIPPAPLLTLAVLTNSSVTLKMKSDQMKVPGNLIRAEALPNKLTEIHYSNKKEYIAYQDLKRLGRILIKRDQPYNPNVLEKFNVKKEELICGIHCPSCFNFNMRKSRQGHWKCETCSLISKEAFRFSINDYLLLVNNVIKNSEFRRFLNIKARRSAVRLLSNYKKTGNKKATTYHLTYYKS
ncbi:nuclease-related domain-containing protein [Sutcliffiella sp. NC1]|uniref:nuclease-related domain-containing protein n=1 Tax=Sutcliffiella sp. NC1 TaxID=3004096 RepID=UPI0022DDD2BC|nr:nuclease-related domain-containing protein [Sutcliffiella sp. NC1]WBL14509.1 nuclease-related domain-containing protein [Sutcliffiella sp. NC1]